MQLRRLLAVLLLLALAGQAGAGNYTGGAKVSPTGGQIEVVGGIGSDSTVRGVQITSARSLNVNPVTDPNLNLTLIQPALLSSNFTVGGYDTSAVVDVKGWTHLAASVFVTVIDSTGVHIRKVLLGVTLRHHAVQSADSISTFKWLRWRGVAPGAAAAAQAVDTLGTLATTDSVAYQPFRSVRSDEIPLALDGYEAMTSYAPRGRAFTFTDRITGTEAPPTRYVSVGLRCVALYNAVGATMLQATGAHVLVRLDLYGWR